MQALIKPNKTVLDTVIDLYGSADYVIKFLLDNTWITSIGFDLTKFAGKVIYYDPTISQNTPPPTNVQPVSPSLTSLYVVKPGQSLLDVCIQLYGNLDFIMKLVTDNNLNGVSSDVLLGKTLIFTSTLIGQPALFNKNKNKNVIYATDAGILDGDFNVDFNNDFSGG